ncbi:MAG: radical SAM protein [bacterium]|nr:radical SAM protein [bacterium]
MNSLLLKRYDKERYTVIFNQNTGFFARVEDENTVEPVYSVHGPELLDISITNYCERSCSFCYRASSINGKEMSLADYEYILKQARDCGALQVALGGGNPNQHSSFERILEVTREKYNIVPSYTTNGDGLSDRILAASRMHCGAVAISFYEPETLFYSNLNKLIDAGIKTNVHFVLSASTLDSAIEFLSRGIQKVSGVNALIFLLFKPAGKGSHSNILRMSSDAELFFSLISTSKIKIGFDSCCVPGIVSQLKYNPISVEACEAGRFSAFISEKMMFYPCSFMEREVTGIDLRSVSILDAWQNASVFRDMRSKIIYEKCKACLHFSVCKGGCSVFNEINLCDCC